MILSLPVTETSGPRPIWWTSGSISRISSRAFRKALPPAGPLSNCRQATCSSSTAGGPVSRKGGTETSPTPTSGSRLPGHDRFCKPTQPQRWRAACEPETLIRWISGALRYVTGSQKDILIRTTFVPGLVRELNMSPTFTRVPTGSCAWRSWLPHEVQRAARAPFPAQDDVAAEGADVEVIVGERKCGVPG